MIKKFAKEKIANENKGEENIESEKVVIEKCEGGTWRKVEKIWRKEKDEKGKEVKI